MDDWLSSFPAKEIFGILVCLICSAFFSGTETALTRLSETRARQLIESQPERWGVLNFWLEKKRRILAALLVGNNIVNILGSVLGYRVALFFFPSYAEAVSVAGMTIIILTFAEITPKNLALHSSENILVPLIRLVWFVDKVFWLVTVPLTRIPEIILRRSGGFAEGPSITEDEIEYHIRLGHDQAVFEEKAQGDLLMSAVEFSDTNVKEVMVPRTQIFGLEIDTPLKEALEVVVESGHSRIPVYKDNLDTIVGLLHAKDLLGASIGNCAPDKAGIEQLVRKQLLIAPETQKISTLLGKMRRRGLHMAIVVDEFGGTSGLITLEDIMEELVGEIRDEFDSDEAPVRKIDANTWIVDAKISLGDLEEATGIDLPSSGDYESVGGFIVAAHGHIPIVGTVVSAGGIQAKVLTSDARRVEKLEIKLSPADFSAEK